MATQVQLRRGTTLEHASFTGALGEVTYDTDKKKVVMHDGATAGGFALGNMALADSPIQTGRLVQLIKEQNTTNLIPIGIKGTPDTVETNAGSSVDGTTFAVKRYLTAATANDTAGLITPVLARVDYKGDWVVGCLTGNTITDYRFWAGATTADLGLIATPTTQHVAAFSYDSTRDGTVFWRTVTCDGTTATITTTTAAFVASTFYTLRIVASAASIKFYIGTTLVSTHTTNIPSGTQNLAMQLCCTALIASARRVDFSRFGVLIP